MSYELIALLTIVCVLTYTFEIVFGLAGTIMMVTVMSFFIAPKTLVIYSLLPQILVATIGLGRTGHPLDLRLLRDMLGFAAVGAVAGLVLFYAVSPDLFRVMFAVAISLFGVYLISAPERIGLHPALARTLDLAAGVSQGLFGVSGPIAMTRLLGTFQDKTSVRNHALGFFLSMNLVRAAGYAVNGTISPEIFEMMAWSAPVLALSLWFANHLHFKVNEYWFRRVVAWVILLGGLIMLAR
jgi:uncharacterized membrane protein YfcA